MRNLVTHAIAALALGTAFAGAASANDDGLRPRMAGVVTTTDQPSWVNTLAFGQSSTDSAQARMTGLLTDNHPATNSALDVRQSSSESAQPGNGFVATRQ